MQSSDRKTKKKDQELKHAQIPDLANYNNNIVINADFLELELQRIIVEVN